MVEHFNIIEKLKKSNFKNITGQKFNKLTALYPVESNGQGVIWLFKCDCGKIKKIRGNSVTSLTIKSCGCSQNNRVAQVHPNNGAIKKRIYHYYQRNAEKRNYEFLVSFTRFVELIENKCYYCTNPWSNQMVSHTSSPEYKYNGIDRLDNNKGYTDDNVVSCCRNCNRAKGIFGEKDFKKWIINLFNNYILKHGNNPN